MVRSARRPGSGPAAVPAPSPPAARTWHGISYRPCPTGAVEVRRLFDYAGAWTPLAQAGELAWEAEADGRLVGGVLAERRVEHGFIHGPVVVGPPAGAEPLEVAAQLVAPLLEEAGGAGVNTLFTRPQGLDRVWVRFGFVPVPEASLPADFRDRPGSGLHAWRRPGSYTIATPDPESGRRGRGQR